MKVPAAERFVAHGVALAVTSNSEALLHQARPFLRRSAHRSLAACAAHLPAVGGDSARRARAVLAPRRAPSVLSSPDVRKVLSALDGNCICFWRRGRTTGSSSIAGVVEWQQKAIVVPGRSFSGKSTLIAASCRPAVRICRTNMRFWMHRARVTRILAALTARRRPD